MSSSNTSLILHVKGTIDETTTLPKQAVRTAIAEGKISRSQLIWSPGHNAWKQVRELPHLLPSQQLAPPPTPRVASGKLPRVATGALPRVATGAIPRVATGALPRVATGALPQVATSSGRPKAATAPHVESPNYQVIEKSHINPLKWLCLGLGVFIFGALGLNYLIVEQPLLSALSQTPYSKVTVYAHLGGFVQSDALVIHIRGSDSLNQSNLTDFLMTLARSTPQRNGVFERISLTSGFSSQYTISGSDWKEFGDMSQADEAQRKEFLLNQLSDAAGQPLVSLINSTMTTEAQRAEKEKIWTAFVAQLTHP